jgi:hypothetical protein
MTFFLSADFSNFEGDDFGKVHNMCGAYFVVKILCFPHDFLGFFCPPFRRMSAGIPVSALDF